MNDRAVQNEPYHGENVYNRNTPNVTIPVRYRNGQLETVFGVPHPELAEGAFADLVVPRYAIRDPEAEAWLLRTEDVRVLERDDRVWLGYNESRVPVKAHRRLLKDVLSGHELRSAIPQGYRLLPVTLRGPLVLRLRGTKRGEFARVACRQDDLDIDAESLNHAYSSISALIEPKRRSHSGNVFLKACVQDRDGRWWLLDDVRRRLEGRFLRVVEFGLLYASVIRMLLPRAGPRLAGDGKGKTATERAMRDLFAGHAEALENALCPSAPVWQDVAMYGPNGGTGSGSETGTADQFREEVEAAAMRYEIDHLAADLVTRFHAMAEDPWNLEIDPPLLCGRFMALAVLSAAILRAVLESHRSSGART